MYHLYLLYVRHVHVPSRALVAYSAFRYPLRSAQHAGQIFRPTRHPPCEGAFAFLHFPLPGHFARLRSRPAIGAACPADRHTAPSHGRLRPLRNGYNRSRLGRGRARDTPIPGTTHLPSSEWNVPYPIGFDVLRTAAITFQTRAVPSDYRCGSDPVRGAAGIALQARRYKCSPK